MDKNKNVERHIIGYVWIYAIIVILILFFASGMKPVLPSRIFTTLNSEIIDT